MVRLALLLTSALALAGPGLAVETDADEGAAIVVTATRDQGYRTETTRVGRTETPLLDLPQSVAVLTRQRLDDQALLSIADALRYVPGAVGAQGEGNRDQIVLRGNNSTADFFVDGLRDDVQIYRDFYNIERLEIVKGANALAFGRGGGGGIINRVTKTPGASQSLAGDVAVDSWGSWRLGADVNQPLGKGVATRLNGVYENAHNHRRFYGLERWALNPTLGFALPGDGRIVLGYEHAEDHRTADRGVPSLNGRPVAGFRDTFFGDPAVNRSNANVDALSVQADVPLAAGLTLHHRSRYADYAKNYQNVFVASAIQNGAVTVQAYREQLTRVNAFAQTDLEWRFATGQVQHQLLLGTELGRQVNDGQRLNGYFGNSLSASVAVADPFVTPAVQLRYGQGASARDNHARADIAAALVQDQISLGQHLIITAGLRVDRFSLTVDNRLTGLGFQRTDTLWSPRLGVVVKPIGALSLYGSYSRSYLPQSGDQFTSLDVSLAALAPERFENWEVGGKWAITPALTATLAVYRLDRDNTRAPGTVAGTVVLTGSQRSEGIEAELSGTVTAGWQLQAGLAVQRARITTTTVNAPAGRHVPLVPDVQASLWSRHHIAGPLDAALGVVHQSASFTGISNSVLLPAWTRLDAALFLKAGKGWQVQLNVENLLNTRYFPTAHTDNNISTGGPRAARLTLRAGF